MNSMQAKVAYFVAKHSLEISVEVRLLDLVSEVGELAKAVLKSSQYGHGEFTPHEAWDNELADTLFALVCLANSTHVDLENALERAITKYAKRLMEKGDVGSGN